MRRSVRLHAATPFLAVLLLLVMAGSAQAASMRSTLLGYRYDAAPGEANDIEAVTEGRVLELRDYGATELDTRVLPRECTDVSDAESVGVRCTSPGKLVLHVRMGDDDDWFNGTYLPKRISLIVDAGDGDNVIEGGAGDDVLYGGNGNDTIYGGRGNDLIVGGNGNNWLRGHGGDDRIFGGNDFDFIYGDGGDDWLYGGGEDDYIYGGAGNDRIFGGAGNDLIHGNKGDDVIYGEAGDDEINGNKGRDYIDAGAGNDLVRARDGEPDTIRCGSGSDVARVDAGEVDQARRDCEKVKQADTPVTEPVDDNGQAASSDEGAAPEGAGAGAGAASRVAGSPLA